ncbi:MAG: endonuclease domain-containing protein [Kiritimatiellales bacterium]|nr:endonuclease domain-containing protein [Kiritimatiellales bacterium]
MLKAIREKLYKKHKSEFTRHLRRNMTPEEKILWNEIRNRRCHNMKFRRQVNIGPYIADFLCMQYRIVVEIDGPIHDSREHKEYDRNRDIYLQEQQYRILRITNQLLPAEDW